ncbi:MAG: hypothetical protein ACE5FS_16105, partial [Paracoccaceae bacterium]
METIRKSPGTGIALEAMAVFCLALAIRLIDLGHGYGGNELFHMLAARSWLDEGTFRVAHGIYDRNSEFTVLLAWLTRVFGEGPMVGRLPAVIAGSLLPVALFAWCRMSVGRTAGWFAAILLCVCP